MTEDSAKLPDNWYQTVFDSVPDVLIIVDGEGRIVAANRQLALVLGYEPDEIIGQGIEILVEEKLREKHRALTKRFLVSPVPRPMGANLELMARHRNGTAIPVEISLRPNELSTPSFVVVALRDVTDRRRIERQVKASERNFRNLFEQCPLGAAILSREGVVVQMNQAFREMFGTGAAPAGSVTVESIAGNEAGGLLHEITAALVCGRTTRRHEFVSECLAFGKRWIQVDLTLEEGPDVEDRLVFGMFCDITDRKDLEVATQRRTEALLQSNRKLEAFTSIASHDLRAPARRTNMFLTLLEKEFGRSLPLRAAEYLGFARSEAQKMQALVDDLLDYSSVCAGPAVQRPVSLIKVLGDTLGILDPEIRASRAKVTFDFLPTVLGNEIQLRRLFANLISNAIKYCRHKPRVHFASHAEGDHYAVSVTDNGIGVAPGELEKIFDIFHRGVSDREFPGTGIGLASCKQIMENHGGRIFARSTDGHGTTFHMEFPVKAARSEPSPFEQVPTPADRRLVSQTELS